MRISEAEFGSSGETPHACETQPIFESRYLLILQYQAAASFRATPQAQTAVNTQDYYPCPAVSPFPELAHFFFKLPFRAIDNYFLTTYLLQAQPKQAKMIDF